MGSEMCIRDRNPHLFEGDLKISQEMIDEYYGIEEKSTKVSLLAVV